jgi:alkanesulfonate monooxygenase SsuD/methylene tetrahydromethanopterin reductase-like flavin-dependent oxidoreductase (luciferase family)
LTGRLSTLYRGRRFPDEQQARVRALRLLRPLGLALVGSPDTVIRKLEVQQKLTGYDVFCARHRIGHLAPALARKSMRLFADHVMPAFA